MVGGCCRSTEKLFQWENDQLRKCSCDILRCYLACVADKITSKLNYRTPIAHKLARTVHRGLVKTTRGNKNYSSSRRKSGEPFTLRAVTRKSRRTSEKYRRSYLLQGKHLSVIILIHCDIQHCLMSLCRIKAMQKVVALWHLLAKHWWLAGCMVTGVICPQLFQFLSYSSFVHLLYMRQKWHIL